MGGLMEAGSGMRPIGLPVHKLKWALLHRKITQHKLAEAVGVRDNFICKIVTYRIEPSAELKTKIAKYLGVSEEEIF